MAISSGLADIAQKSAVLFLAGTTVYYMVNVGVLVNRRVQLKNEGRLQEELDRLTGRTLTSNEKVANESTTSSSTPSETSS